jgi:AcrR family transcriptional regulator
MSQTVNRSIATPHANATLRERTRRAVQAELLEAAERLILSQGYEATNIDQVATEAGMSRRSFFRYFSSKEDLVLGRYERIGEQWIEALTSRPLDEPLWTSMRRVMDVMIESISDEQQARRLAAMRRVVNSSPSLRAGQLERFDRVQYALADLARGRAELAGLPWATNDPAPRAIVGAAFACFMAAHAVAGDRGDLLADAVDRAMAVVSARS